ncbi:unnamed protein product [Leuciscus chuanchicus]
MPTAPENIYCMEIKQASDIQPCHPSGPPGDRQSSVLDILQPEAHNDLPRQRREPLDDNESGRRTPSLSHQELTSIIFSLATLPQASNRSPEVRRFLARQPENIQSNYQQLEQAIITGFSDLRVCMQTGHCPDTKQT